MYGVKGVCWSRKTIQPNIKLLISMDPFKLYFKYMFFLPSQLCYHQL